MSRLDARLAKLENVKNKKPVIWAFVPHPDGHPVAEREKDKEMLREFASRYFGITDFYFSIFTARKGTTLAFNYIEYADFCAVIDKASNQGSYDGEDPRTPEAVRERNDILADYLESFLFENEEARDESDAA